MDGQARTQAAAGLSRRPAPPRPPRRPPARPGRAAARTRCAPAGPQFTGSCAANQARLCAATVKPSGASGPLCVAEAERFPTPELPPPPPSAQTLGARRPRGTVTARGPRASPARRMGATTSKETPPPVPTHTPPSSFPTPENRTLPIKTGKHSLNPHLSAVPRGCHAPRNLPIVASQASPSRPPGPSESRASGTRPGHPRPAGTGRLSALPPRGVNINQQLMRSRAALKVPLGTILPWLRDSGRSRVGETEAPGAAEGHAPAPRARWFS